MSESKEPSATVVLALTSSSLYKTFLSYSELRKDRMKDEAKQEIRQKNDTLFGLEWIDDQDEGNDALLLVGCTGSGDLVVWKAASGASNTRDSAKPILRMNISSGKLYSIKIERIVNKRLLFACGDDGVLVFDLEREVINRLKNSGKKVAKSTPLATFKPHPSPLEDKGIEINEIQILRNGDGKTYLFGAAGDSFGCYKWDLETKELIRTYSSPGRGYLCSIRVVPSPDEDEHNLLLLGGEDGVLTVWDLDQDKRLDHIDLNNASAADVALTESSSSNMPSKAPRRSNSKRSKTASNRWISSICTRDRNWWTVAGGTTESLGGGPSGRGGGNSGRIGTGGGFVATFHAATRSMVAWSETREIPQKLASVPSNSTDFAVLSQHNLLSVANEGVVTHWDALTLDSNSKRRVWCSPPCAYAAAVSSDGLFTAVGGVGCYVDVFEQSGEKSMRLVL